MEYQNYLIVYKQVDFNLFIKFTNKKSNQSYENIITPEQIDNLPMNKFIKMLENSVNLVPNYNITIKLSDDNNQLIICLTYDTDMINISNTIHLEKTSINQVKSSDVLIKRIEKLERTIEQLERITEENDKITIAKLLNVETYNHNCSSLTCQYLKFSKNTEHIEIILPPNKHDISRDKRNNYELIFNYDIDPNEVFTNLKKITISDCTYLNYFFNYCIYRIIASPNSGREYEYKLCISNNTIEEIEFYEYLYLCFDVICDNKKNLVIYLIKNM